MREFGLPITEQRRLELLTLIGHVYGLVPARREVTAAEFAMEDEPTRIVVKEIEIKWEGERLRIGKTLDTARPPFEWVYEVSADVGESDYFKHYLVRADDIVLAQRKVLTPIDDQEAAILQADLQSAQMSLGTERT
jgi:hypothetical protein